MFCCFLKFNGAPLHLGMLLGAPLAPAMFDLSLKKHCEDSQVGPPAVQVETPPLRNPC